MPLNRWRVGRDCEDECAGCGCTVRFWVKEGCSPFAAISGASVGIYSAETGGTAIDSGSTDGSGYWTGSVPSGGYHWVEWSKSGCAAGVRKRLFLTCGGTTSLALWCSTGKHTLTLNKCCSGGSYTGPVSVSKGGVSVGGGSGPTVVFPKSEGTGSYSVTIPAAQGCAGGTFPVTVTSGNLCTNTSSTITLGTAAGRTCCNNVPVPTTIKIIDSLGVHTGGWSQTATGSRSRVNQTFTATDATWHPQNITSPTCQAPGCTSAWTLWAIVQYAPNTATTEVSYVLSCITGGFRLTATWRYRQLTASEGQGDICRLCGGVCNGICTGNPAPGCITGWPTGDPVNVGLSGGVCVHDWPDPQEWWRSNTYAPAGAGSGWTSVSASADWLGTISDPDSISMTFNFVDPGWLFDGPRGGGFPPPAILPPPPPGGLSVTVTGP